MTFGNLSKGKILGVSLGATAVIFVAGIVFWAGFGAAMEATNQTEFCISCHEMRDTVYQEYKETIHYTNRSGVRTECADCHVPKTFGAKLVRKILAVNDIYHTVLGTVDTPEKFEAKRLELATRVWAYMEASDSRECRSCHAWDAMGEELQQRRSWSRHQRAQERGQTCIDCHKGIAHKDVSHLVDD